MSATTLSYVERYCAPWHDKQGASHPPEDVKKLLDVGGKQPTPPFPAYVIGEPPQEVYVTANDLCQTCQEAVEASYHRGAPESWGRGL